MPSGWRGGYLSICGTLHKLFFAEFSWWTKNIIWVVNPEIDSGPIQTLAIITRLEFCLTKSRAVLDYRRIDCINDHPCFLIWFAIMWVCSTEVDLVLSSKATVVWINEAQGSGTPYCPFFPGYQWPDQLLAPSIPHLQAMKEFHAGRFISASLAPRLKVHHIFIFTFV